MLSISSKGQIAPSWLAAIALAFVLVQPAQAADLQLNSSVQNLANLEEAEAYAKNLIEQIKTIRQKDPSYGFEKNPVVIVHAGDKIPQQLKWVLLHLDRAEIRFQAHQVSSSEVAQQLEAAQGTIQKIEYQSSAAKKSQLGILKRAALMARKFAGLPQGFTWWFKVKRDGEVVRGDRWAAVSAGAIAAASVGISFYVSQTVNTPDVAVDWLKVAMPAAALGTWVVANVNWFRSVHKLMAQGKTINVKKGELVAEGSVPFFWGMNIVRGMMTNFIVLAAVHGPRAFTDPANLGRAVDNALINSVARSEVDRLIERVTPTEVDENGDIIRKKGQLSEEGARRLNWWWGNLHGLTKNLHLFNVEDPFIYLAAGNMGLMVLNRYQSWWGSLKSGLKKLGQLVSKNRQKNPTTCETYLVIRQ